MTSAATPTEHPCQSGGDCSCGGACGGPQTALQKAMAAEQARWARGTWFTNGAGGVASSTVALANTHSTLANKAYEQIVAQSAKFAHDPAAHRKQHADFAAQFGVRFADAAMQKPAGGCAGCAGKNRSGGTGLTKAGAVNQAAVALGATAIGAGNCICPLKCGKGQTYKANCDGCECIPIQCSPGQSQDPKSCDCVPGCTGPSASKLCGGNLSCDVGQVCIKRCCDGSNSLAQFVCSSPADAVHTSDGICSKF